MFKVPSQHLLGGTERDPGEKNLSQDGRNATILLFDTFSLAFQRRDGTLIEISSIWDWHWAGVQRMDSCFVCFFRV